jgi:hypothetical protein
VQVVAFQAPGQVGGYLVGRRGDGLQVGFCFDGGTQAGKERATLTEYPSGYRPTPGAASRTPAAAFATGAGTNS